MQAVTKARFVRHSGYSDSEVGGGGGGAGSDESMVRTSQWFTVRLCVCVWGGGVQAVTKARFICHSDDSEVLWVCRQ